MSNNPVKIEVPRAVLIDAVKAFKAEMKQIHAELNLLDGYVIDVSAEKAALNARGVRAQWNADVIAASLGYLNADAIDSPVPYVCPLCGQRIDDGLACGCGARN